MRESILNNLWLRRRQPGSSRSMKIACIVLSLIIAVAIMATAVMVKFATDVTVSTKKLDNALQTGFAYHIPRSMGVIALSDNSSTETGERFPYVAAIIRNTSNKWSLTCFGSIVLVKWAVTSAHCRKIGYTHRILLYHDFVRNINNTYPVLFWRLHEKYNATNPSPQYNIAVAKLKLDFFPFTMKLSVFDDKVSYHYVDASVWKSVSGMNKKMYLTNEFERFEGQIVNSLRCFETFGFYLDESLICVDFSLYEECFLHEFGPLFIGDKIVGVLSVRPRDCDIKIAIFTNVSYYSQWILKATHTTYVG